MQVVYDVAMQNVKDLYKMIQASTLHNPFRHSTDEFSYLSQWNEANKLIKVVPESYQPVLLTTCPPLQDQVPTHIV